MSTTEPPVVGPERRWWLVAEADAYLPALDRLFDSVETAIARKGRRADQRLLLHGLVATLAEDGIVVRDLRRRLVDFPGRGPDGRQVLWCRVGDEPSIAWWHDPAEGFAGRRSLHEDPPW